MTKQAELDKISQEIENCKVCKVGKRGMAVPGEGNSDAEIIFLGEAPGRTEAATGRPFVGRSGKLLRSLIDDAGLAEESVFITSPVKYLPDYVTPKREDVEHGLTHLKKQIDVIDPKFIVLLGRIACLAILGKHVSVAAEHGKIIEENGRKYFITVHPAAALRFKKMKELLLEDFMKLKQIV